MRRFILLLSVVFGVNGLATAGEAPIELETESGKLEGTLTVPEAGKTWPVMLIVSGSGPTDRDGNAPVAAGRNNSLKLLAEALAGAGIASVRYDKRGIGESKAAGKPEVDLRFDDYVQDATDWSVKLSADRRFSRVGVIGHSEGATIALFVARRGGLASYVSIAGPSRKASDVIRGQLVGKLPLSLAERSEFILESLEHGKTVSDVPAELQPLFRPSVQPYLVSWFKVDPLVEISKISIPCLILQGTTDIQVGEIDAQELGVAQSKCKVVIIPGMNHVLKEVIADRAQQVSSYGNRSLPLAPELVLSLSQFLSGL